MTKAKRPSDDRTVTSLAPAPAGKSTSTRKTLLDQIEIDCKRLTAERDEAGAVVESMDAEEWRELCRLREAVKGPDGYATWQDAATAERVRRVKAERDLAAAQQAGAPLAAMPEMKKRRPYKDNEPDGYLESDRDFMQNNEDLVLWYLEHDAAIRTVLAAAPAQQAGAPLPLAPSEAKAGTTSARFGRLMAELEKRLPDPEPFSAAPPEARYLSALDRLLATTPQATLPASEAVELVASYRATADGFEEIATQPQADAAEPGNGPWRCFHCEECFTTVEAAKEHFGPTERQQPACSIDIKAYREMEQRMLAYNEEDAAIHREMHAKYSDHQLALVREEERGYSRGLKDAKRHPADLGLQKIQPQWIHVHKDCIVFSRSDWVYPDSVEGDAGQRDAVRYATIDRMDGDIVFRLSPEGYKDNEHLATMIKSLWGPTK